MAKLRIVLVTALLTAPASLAHAASIVDFIDGSGAGLFAGLTTISLDPSDWYTFQATAGTAIVLETLEPQTFDTVLLLYRTPAGPAKAGDLVSSFIFLRVDDDGGPGNLSRIAMTLTLDAYYAVEVRGFGSEQAGVYAYRTTGNVTAVPDAGATPVPEPGTIILVGTALILSWRARRL